MMMVFPLSLLSIYDMMIAFPIMVDIERKVAASEEWNPLIAISMAQKRKITH
jgi:hypothetical protein